MNNGKPRKKASEFEHSSGNVFADLGLANPEELLAKAALVLRIDKLIQARKLTMSKAADILGVTHKDVSELLRGDLDLCSIDRLFRLLNAMDQDVEIVVRPKRKTDKVGSTRVVAE